MCGKRQKIRRIALSAGLFSLTLFYFENLSFAGPTETTLEGDLSYEKALESATGASPVAESYRLRSDADQSRTGFLSRSFMPKVVGNVGYEKFQEGNFSRGHTFFGLDGILNVYAGGADRAEDTSRNARYHLSRATLNQRQIEIAKDVAEAYLAATVAQARIETIRSLFEEAEKLQRSADRRVKSGISTNTDLLEFEIYKKKLNQEEISARVSSLQAKNTIARVLGFDRAGDSFKVSATIPHTHWNESPISISEVTSWTEDLRKAATDFAYAESFRAASWWRPRVDLYSRYGMEPLSLRSGSADLTPLETEFAYGIRLTIPIYDGLSGYRDASAQNVLAEADRLLARGNQLEQNANSQNLILELEQNDTLLHSAIEVVELTKTYLKQTLNEYGRGVKNSVDALSALQRLKDAQYEVLDLEQRYATSRAQLEFARNAAKR